MKTSYLDSAIHGLIKIGIHVPPAPELAPVLSLLEKVSKYNAAKVMSIANTMQQSSVFNEAVRDNIQGMDVSTRFSDIAKNFESIRSDLVDMSEWMQDGKLNFTEKVKLNWMSVTRGSIPNRFEKIRETYLEVSSSVKDQIEREGILLDAYRDFRMALKDAEITAYEVFSIAGNTLEERKNTLAKVNASLQDLSADATPVERSSLEKNRDEAIRDLQEEDKTFQIIKDIADDLKTSCNTADLVFARLQQTHSVKVQLHQRSISFFSTNEVVFTGLSASFTSMSGLAEATNTMEAMKDGMNKGIEAMAKTGTTQLESSLRTAYGATLSVSSTAALADAIVEFQSSSFKLVEELRMESSKTANEIEAATSNAKARFVALLQK